MRYWFDLLTPKQVLFFRPVIERLRTDGHAVLTTSRRYREVEQLASMLGLELSFVGSRGGKDPLEQLKLSLERMGGSSPPSSSSPRKPPSPSRPRTAPGSPSGSE